MFRKKDFYVNARAVIERDGEHGREVLLQVRAKPGQPRTLELPGGQLDPFESILAALRRVECLPNIALDYFGECLQVSS